MRFGIGRKRIQIAAFIEMEVEIWQEERRSGLIRHQKNASLHIKFPKHSRMNWSRKLNRLLRTNSSPIVSNSMRERRRKALIMSLKYTQNGGATTSISAVSFTASAQGQSGSLCRIQRHATALRDCTLS